MTENAASTMQRARRRAAHRAGRVPGALLATVPILTVPMVLASSLTATPAAAAETTARRATTRTPGTTSATATNVSAATAVALTAPSNDTVPSNYTVRSGDTVSSVAARYGLATASVLALNGLGWKSLIYPGQVLRLSKGASGAAAAAAARSYTIRAGDTISALATRFGVSVAAMLRANGLRATSIIYPGQSVEVPATTTLDAVTTSSATASTTATADATSYTVVSGDTVSSIAARFGVSVAAVLAANDLDAASILYPGVRLTIPSSSVYIAGVGVVTVLGTEQTANARLIIRIGRELGVPDRGIVVALATAMQESALTNLDHGDLDSVGLFQQRPSQGWGTVAQLTDPEYATRLFYGGASGPNSDETPGLLDIAGWQSMTIAQAAQAVQVSAYPEAYAQWEASARYWLAELG
ncbi:MAG: LysM peptidoglycan-binding domain-containing protein [Microbacteriaceae bacterium]